MQQVGVFGGSVSLGAFMYYTIQSNLLALFMFAILAVRTAKALREDGVRCGSGWYAHFEVPCVVAVLVTMIVFWSLLAPQFRAGYLLSFENLAVHTVTPLLCLADYILFAGRARLKYRSVFYCSVFPLFYLAFATIAGYAGYVYYYEATFDNYWDASPSSMTPVRFPYFFLDYDRIGAMVAVYVVAITLFVLLLAHGIYWVNRKVAREQVDGVSDNNQ
jgi:hypothetical protein